MNKVMLGTYHFQVIEYRPLTGAKDTRVLNRHPLHPPIFLVGEVIASSRHGYDERGIIK